MMDEVKLKFKDGGEESKSLSNSPITGAKMVRSHTPIPNVASIGDISTHVIEVQNNLLGEVEDEEFSEDYEEELLIK